MILWPDPTSYNGNTYLITIKDLLLLYPEAYPIPDKSAETIAKVLTQRLIPAHSCYITILSDNGTEYKNKIVEEVCKKLKI